MRINKLLFGIVLLTLIIALASCKEGGVIGSSTPGDIVKSMMKNVADENYAAAVAVFVTKKGKELSKDEQDNMKSLFPNAKKEFDKNGGLKEVNIIKETISEDGNTATVKYSLVYGSGKESGSETAELIKINGVWRGEVGW